MGEITKDTPYLPPEQQAIRAKCFHPSGSFVEFDKEEVEQSIPDRFEQMVRRYPERIAVKTKNYTLTYAELNRMANRVARAILARRGEGGEPIALLLEHDAPMVAAILGTFKAGKIFVPLDPSYPQAGLNYLFEDSQAALIVTDNKNLLVAEGLARSVRQLINIDELDSSLSDENIGLPLSPDTLAYILYTSGSTAQAKGVLQNHRNTLHTIMNYTNAFRVCVYDRLTLLHSCNFSVAIIDVFCALLNGAAVYPFNVRAEGMDHLTDWLVHEEITIYNWNPAAFRSFVGTLTMKDELPKLRLVVLGSEPVISRDAELYKKYFSPQCILVNRLGSTETTNFRLYFIDRDAQINGTIVPVGYAVEDMEVLLLDGGGERVGFNEVGEIAVKSRDLAVGYWRNPALTRAVFLPDPMGGNQRIYLTGDLGRMRPDGCLTHVGRKDFQVKIRGYRIELGEIEAALLNLYVVKQAVVVARGNEAGDDCLTAYVVPSVNPRPTMSALRRALAKRLPDYMIPAAFVVVDSLPLLPNGKVDRRALPAPGRTRPELEVPFVSPRTPIEEALAGIWAEALGIDQVGVVDNFFDLGGHSLLAGRVISRMRDTFQMDVPIQSFLEAPTVADIALVITRCLARELEDDELAHTLAYIESLPDETTEGLPARQGDSKR